MSNYALADRTTQWFADNYPGARLVPNCGTLHTTESPGWPSYGGGKSAPNYTARPDFTARRLVWRAHFPDEMSSRALENDPGGVETNTANNVQVELVGTCDPKHRVSWNGQGAQRAGRDYLFWPEAPDWALLAVARFLVDMHKRHGIPLAGPALWNPYPKSYGTGGGQRMSFAQWRVFKGWAGHQHVPENDHGDPGNLAFARIIQLAKSQLAPAPQPTGDTFMAQLSEAEQRELLAKTRDIHSRLPTRYWKPDPSNPLIAVSVPKGTAGANIDRMLGQLDGNSLQRNIAAGRVDAGALAKAIVAALPTDAEVTAEAIVDELAKRMAAPPVEPAG